MTSVLPLFNERTASRYQHIVCATAGNFGQGMAYAARQHGSLISVFAAINANSFKVERMRELGANIHLVGTTLNETLEAARAAQRKAAH